MAISVKNINPEKLTSLLNWFKTNADDLYAKGSAGVKNVLDKALMRQGGNYMLDLPDYNTALAKASYNLSTSGKIPTVYNELGEIDVFKNPFFNTYNDALSHASHGRSPIDTANGLGVLDDFGGIGETYYDVPWTPKIPKSYSPGNVPFNKSMPLSNLVTEMPHGYYSRDVFVRPHKNTALNKWYASQLQKQFKK